MVAGVVLKKKVTAFCCLSSIKKSNKKHMNFASRSEGRQDRVRPRFLIKLDMKPRMHLVEISIFSLNLVIVRLIKIMNRADKNWAEFLKIKYVL